MNSDTLRILDANANRAREALRVLEDYARFSLNDAALSAELKTLRHELTTALKPLLPEAILHRDTPNDVGCENKTATEFSRPDLASVIIAAGKRLGEALRSLEEFSKALDPSIAAQIEKLRYRFYDLELGISRTLHPAKFHARLCVLITESVCKLPWLEAAEQAILGGADCLQLREKALEGGELLCRAKAFVQLCKKHNVISIINDRPDIAILADADGVHVGQTDLPATEVRKLIGPNKFVGVSTHNLDQAREAVRDGANYIGVGPIYKSPTKPRDFIPGLSFAAQVTKEIPIPTLAIAGITPQNASEVLATGITGLAVTAAVLASENPRSAAAELRQICDNRSAHHPPLEFRR
ncbi:MAG TPA: thiamine phosphate synthase [Tepidisphaeraceae bacterium]|jgi:thiamine-phosphate pyrophosphorylase